MYASLYSRVGAVRAEALFAETARVLQNVARFLGVEGLNPPRKQTCWHDCGTRKSAFSIAESLRIQLEALYAPWNAMLYSDLREARAAGRTPPQEPDFGEFDAHGVNCTDAPLAPPTREVRL